MMTAATLNQLEMTNTRNFFGFALGFHIVMFAWNPILLSGGAANNAPLLMQVEFRDKLPEMPKPPQVVKKIEHKTQVVKRAHKSGLSLARHMTPVKIHPTRHETKVAAKPAARTRVSLVKMPKFVPHASDEDVIATAAHPAKLATATTLHPSQSPFQSSPKLVTKSRGIRASDVHFELADRGAINPGGQVVNIPVGEESGDQAVVASAPQLHDAPKGLQHISNSGYQAPLGEGVGELAGKNRGGYRGTIQVTGVEASDEEIAAVSKGHGGAISGQGFEIGGPIGDRKILRRHVPEYPSWAEEKGISALVKIFFTVNADGSIRPYMRIVRSSGYAELDDLAKQALKKWKFSPTSANSGADEAWGVITFRFTLA
jgi:TonB family protein